MDLYPVSKMMVNASFKMGGADMYFYKALFCPYIRDDGTPCYDERSGSPYMECPICTGKGVVYSPPTLIRGIFQDTEDDFDFQDGSGGWVDGHKAIVFDPTRIRPTILKERESMARRLLRDKFCTLTRCCGPDGERNTEETYYLLTQPSYPNTNNAKLYGIATVGTNY